MRACDETTDSPCETSEPPLYQASFEPSRSITSWRRGVAADPRHKCVVLCTCVGRDNVMSCAGRRPLNYCSMAFCTSSRKLIRKRSLFHHPVQFLHGSERSAHLQFSFPSANPKPSRKRFRILQSLHSSIRDESSRDGKKERSFLEPLTNPQYPRGRNDRACELPQHCGEAKVSLRISDADIQR